MVRLSEMYNMQHKEGSALQTPFQSTVTPRYMEIKEKAMCSTFQRLGIMYLLLFFMTGKLAGFSAQGDIRRKSGISEFGA